MAWLLVGRLTELFVGEQQFGGHRLVVLLDAPQ